MAGPTELHLGKQTGPCVCLFSIYTGRVSVSISDYPGEVNTSRQAGQVLWGQKVPTKSLVSPPMQGCGRGREP